MVYSVVYRFYWEITEYFKNLRETYPIHFSGKHSYNRLFENNGY